jgi:hypothetical protein
MKNKTVPAALENVLQLVNSLPKGDWVSRQIDRGKPPIDDEVLGLLDRARQSVELRVRESCLEAIKAVDNLDDSTIEELRQSGLFTPSGFPPEEENPSNAFRLLLPTEEEISTGQASKQRERRQFFLESLEEAGYGYAFSDEDAAEIIKIISDWLNSLPENIAEHLLKFEDAADLNEKYAEINIRYQELLATRDELTFLASYTQRVFTKENNYQSQDSTYLLCNRQSDKVSMGFLLVENNGTARIQKSLFAEAVDGIDVRRIRLCEACEKLFWAGRLDQIFCSKTCSGLKRIQRWREKSAEYELNRFQNEEKRAGRTSNNGSF